MRFASRASLIALSPLVAAACARGPAPASPPTGDALRLPPQAAEIRAACGLAIARPVAVHDVTRAGFRRALRDEVARHPLDPSRGPFVAAFGFGPPGARITHEAIVSHEVDSLLGVYVPADRAVYVRAPAKAQPAHGDAPDAILVHELVHAAQDDRFGFAPIDAHGVPDDERLARRAIYEGHATVVTWAVLADRSGGDLEAAMRHHAYGAFAQATRLGGGQDVDPSPRDPALARAETLFPYTAGAFFVAEAVRAGGFGLVAKVFGHLPTTTEQVLHPQKYFDGEGAIPVTEPSAPPGWNVTARGRMGELRTRVLLSTKLPLDRAVAASAGWGGDAFAVLERGEGERPAVLWSTVWDDEAAAIRFAAALEEATSCAGDAAACPFGPVAQRRVGTKVAWVRGIDRNDEREAQLAALVTLPRAPAPKVALFGPLKLADDSAGRVPDDPVVTLAPLGLRFVVPETFRVQRSESADFQMHESGRRGLAHVARTEGSLDAAGEAQTRALTSAILSTSYPVRYEGARDVELAIGRGRELTWQIEGGGAIWMTIVPICHATQLLTFMRVARSEETRVALARWMASIEPVAPGLAPVCASPSPTD